MLYLFDWRYSPNPFLTLCCSRGSDAEQFRMMNPDPGIICAGEDGCMHYRIMTCEMRSLPNDAIALIPIRGRIWRGLRRWLWRRRFLLIPLRGRIRCAFSSSQYPGTAPSFHEQPIRKSNSMPCKNGVAFSRSVRMDILMHDSFWNQSAWSASSLIYRICRPLHPISSLQCAFLRSIRQLLYTAVQEFRQKPLSAKKFQLKTQAASRFSEMDLCFFTVWGRRVHFPWRARRTRTRAPCRADPFGQTDPALPARGRILSGRDLRFLFSPRFFSLRR